MSNKCFYVYIHKDPNGNVFYVGKGKGKRAWDKSKRHSMWKRYVKRFSGRFNVEIYRDNLTEDEALNLEYELMDKYGAELINWSNISVDGNWKAYEKIGEIDRKIESILNRA